MPNTRYRRPPVRPLPPTNTGRKSLFIFIGIGLVLIGGSFWLFNQQKTNSDANSATQQQKPAFDKAQFSLTDPASPWLVVNKQRPLSPKNYVPTSLVAPNITLKGAATSEAMQLTPETAAALEKLDADAKAAGLALTLVSGYRSYNSQKTIYESEVKGFGQEIADKESARPGHSEHQTGLAADVTGANKKCEIKECFADTTEGAWLAANAYKYGFIIRYAKDKTDVTGYVYEPWHLRYVGTTLSEEMHRTGIETLEEFFELGPAPTY